MYETRTFDNEHGDPVVVLVATGTHDVSRLTYTLSRGTVEQIGLADRITRSLRRHNAGRMALKLLRDHGGPDFTEEPPVWPPLMRAGDVNQLYQDRGIGAVRVGLTKHGDLDWLMLNEGRTSRQDAPFLLEWPNLLVVAHPCGVGPKPPDPPANHPLSTPVPWEPLS